MRSDWWDKPLAHLVMHMNGGEKSVPIFDQLFVGRQCAGIDEHRRLVIPDPNISRNHLEIRLDVATDRAFLIDVSTNGTLLNGMPLERAVQVPLRPDDQISVGDAVLIFRSDRFNAAGVTNTSPTLTRIVEETMVMVVGDITNYSTISEVTDNRVIARSLNYLWHELNLVLRAHRGTLNHYAGDALYAVWELRTIPTANELAIDFALAANRRVGELGPTLPLRAPDGSPIRMGWGVVQGRAAIAAMTRTVTAVIGDATNVAFRLAGIAGRAGHPDVMVSSRVHAAVEAHYAWGHAEQVAIKGRRGMETVFPVLARS
ncbi:MULTISPECIES: adenylate/guanylate cyclase domain-containing protein [unclassified Mycobacterium]|uniref:adenylate/guanylate cyclase domain-containing protein n=1 Tax=unclassified Mycobacterium TaxID=2642494 RepID=UPI0007FE1CF7|nr:MULTISPECIES: adenylate/guanylate cyclase domain-containing protein [unclassified Mycobacterium]OBH07678.1 adenylate cyclase [Mycobacterium sp. E2699]OBI54089.1 adenylate cyclase [Mycobacterium sp. E787]